MQLIECPRDAMQGIKRFIPTDTKVAYMASLLRIGFDTLDVGSFVSERLMPQMKDTKAVIDRLSMAHTKTRLLVIVANERGFRQACDIPKVSAIGYPLSISETFQIRNTGKNITDSLNLVTRMRTLTEAANKELVIYLSMGFGNPYGDPYSEEAVVGALRQLADRGIQTVSLADTIGVATPQQVKELLGRCQSISKRMALGLHLHVKPAEVASMVKAVLDSDCKRIDAVIGGYGGCPMAQNSLTGNLPTEALIASLQKTDNLPTGFNLDAFEEAKRLSQKILAPNTIA